MYIPRRNDIVLLDFDPAKGKEIGKNRPAFVLSSERYNKKTGLIICCPISTSIRGAPTEVKISNLDVPCVVATTLVQTLDWKERKAMFLKPADQDVFKDVTDRVIALIGRDHLINSNY